MRVVSFASGALCLYYCLSLCDACPKWQDDVQREDDADSMQVDSFSPIQSNVGHSSSSASSGYDRERAEQTLQQVNRLIQQMAVWSATLPETYLHRLRLLQAERSRLCFRCHWRSHHLVLPAMRLYQEASDAARCNGFLLERALILERHGQFQFECGRDLPACHFGAHAYQMYAEAGCTLKLKELSVFMNRSFIGADLEAVPMSMPMPAVQSRVVCRTPGAIAAPVENRTPQSPPSPVPSNSFDMFSVLKGQHTTATATATQRLKDSMDTTDFVAAL